MAASPLRRHTQPVSRRSTQSSIDVFPIISRSVGNKWRLIPRGIAGIGFYSPTMMCSAEVTASLAPTVVKQMQSVEPVGGWTHRSMVNPSMELVISHSHCNSTNLGNYNTKMPPKHINPYPAHMRRSLELCLIEPPGGDRNRLQLFPRWNHMKCSRVILLGRNKTFES